MKIKRARVTYAKHGHVYLSFSARHGSQWIRLRLLLDVPLSDHRIRGRGYWHRSDIRTHEVEYGTATCMTVVDTVMSARTQRVQKALAPYRMAPPKAVVVEA